MNDPVLLHGELSGPFAAGDGPTPVRVDGHLTVTRGDVLGGLARAAPDAFRYAAPAARAGLGPRCFHMQLAGEPGDQVRRGRGVILAYPLLRPELLQRTAANEFLVSQMLYDVLSGLQRDLVHDRVDHPLRKFMLPVPSRPQL